MSTNLLFSAINTDNLFLNDVVGTDYIEILEQIKVLAREYVNQFAQSTDFAEKMAIAFGDNINFSSLQEKWKQGEIIFPTIEVRSQSELGNAWGAFAQSTGKIYLAEELLSYEPFDKVLEVLLEEYGHYIESQINTTDTQGDEGAIFSKLVLGENILEKELEFLQNKNDQVPIILDGTTVEIEQQGSELNPYNFQIIAKGSDIEKGVSINDRGKVAFVQGGDLFVSDGSNSPVNFTDQSSGTIQPGIQINNQDQVIATTKFLFDTANVFLWDATDSDQKNIGGLIAKSGIPRNYGDPTEYFELLLSYPSVNNLAHAQNQYPSLSEKTVFSSLLKNDFGSLGSVLSTPVFEDNAGTAIYNTIPIDNPIYPVIADNGEIVVRLGNRDRTNDNGPMSPIVVYKPDLKSNSRVSIAGVFNGFQALGQKPGISDDGQIVVFYGDLAAADLVDETPPMNEKEQLDLLNTTQGNLWYKNGGKLRLDELEPGAGIFASIAVKDAFWDKNNNQIFDTGDEDISRVLVKIADLYDGFNYFENNGAVRVNSTHRGEDFIDTNSNGIWDFGESYTDSNKNGVYDISKQAVQIIYLADNRNNDKGIYESSLHFVPQNVGRFDPDRPSGFLVSEPSYIIGKDTVLPQWGGVTTPTLGNSIKDVDIHDSINQRGDIVFWAENYLEETAVIRASQQSVKFDQALYKVKENHTQATITLTREGDLQEPLSLFVNFVDILGINEGGEIIIDLLVNISSIFLSQLGSIPLAIANEAISSASAEMEDFEDGFSAIPVFFAANQSTAEVEIIIKDDSEYEGDQAVVLSLSHNNFTTNPLLVNNLGTDALLVIEDDESIIDALKDIVPSDKESLVDTLLGMVLFTLNVTKDALRTEEGLPKIKPSLNWKDTLKQLIQLDVTKETFKGLKSTLAESIIIPFYGSILQHGIIFALEDYYKYQKKLESLSPTFFSPRSEASGVSSEVQSSSESLVEGNNLTPVSVNDLGYMIGLSTSDTDSSGILIKPDGQIVYLQDNNNQTIIPVDINNSQQVVGYSKTINDLPYAVMWQDNVVTNLVTPLGEVASQATAINESGQIIINSQNEQGALDAFLWLNGELTKLNQNNQNSYAVDINNLGQVIGYLETSNGGFGLEGFVWQNGSMTKLGSLGGSLTIPTAINEQGKIIGIATTAEGEFQSFIWENGQIQPIVSLDSNGSIPIDINDSGQVIGIYDQVSTVNNDEIESRAFLWDSGNITELSTLGGETTLPLSINNLGQIIGLSDLDDSVSAPFIWQQGAFLNLEDFISMNENSELVNILDINDSGQVIAVFQDQNNNIDISLATIQNNQLAPQIYISNVFLREGNNDNTEFVFRVTLSQASDSVITVDYATADNTAIASSDYISVNGTLTFNAGEMEKTITVQVIGDTEIEPDETFFVNLSNASGGAIASSQGMGTIINDDQDTSVIVVNSTSDLGDADPFDNTPDVDLTTPGLQTTLRAAIEFANQNSGLNRIFFDIPTTDPGYDPTTGTFTIKPNSALPTITDAIIIDGTSQSGFTNKPIIELNGENADSNLFDLQRVSGLTLRTGDSTIKGLVINRFRSGNGISILDGNNNIIEGNFIGTDITGTDIGDTSDSSGDLYDDPANYDLSRFIGNGLTGGDYDSYDGLSGIFISSTSTGNIIGGTTGASRNVISGNGVGITIEGNNNNVRGNYIGTDVTGTVALGNIATFIGDFFNDDWVGKGIGITVFGSENIIGGTTPEARNIVSGNKTTSNFGDGTGIVLAATYSGTYKTPDRNLIQGNYIGTDVTGTLDLGNSWYGIRVSGNENIIGGEEATAGNLISGNNFIGVSLEQFARDNRIGNNLIGTTVNGLNSLSNGSNGISVYHGENNIISQNTVAFNGSNQELNTLSGSDAGISIGGGGANNQVSDNQVFSNTGDGLWINDYHTLVSANQIFANGNNGVVIDGLVLLDGSYYDTNSVSVISNVIYDNAQWGIDLGNDGVTPNDSGDIDTGSNNLQNYPNLTSVTSGKTTTNIEGNLSTDKANTNFYLQFFANTKADDSGFGEGETLIGSINVLSDNNGLINFVATLPISLSQDNLITATATATNRNGNYTDTSEFSQAIPITVATDTELSINDVSKLEGNSGATEFTFTVSLSQSSTQTVTVSVESADSTATLFDNDYQKLNPTLLTFTPGEVSKTVTVLVNGDTKPESDEYFFVRLKNAVNATITDSQGVGTIKTDEPLPTVIVVNSTGDQADANPFDGLPDVDLVTPGLQTTLRAAIEFANSIPSINTITFDLPESDTYTISPNTPLPEIYDPIIIDGTTQAGFSGIPLIKIDGSNIQTSANGLLITAGYSTVKGLEISNFNTSFGYENTGTIHLKDSGNNIIQGNYFTNNNSDTYGGSLLINNSANNLIGGVNPEQKNIFYQNLGGSHILVSGINARGNQIQGNYIGVDASGTRISDNEINTAYGYPSIYGIKITDNASGNIIGGSQTGSTNVISGNEAGIGLIGPDGGRGGANQSIIQNNYIGTDKTGQVALGNSTGIQLYSAPNNFIGGTAVNTSNIISGNNRGIEITGNNAINNLIQGNLIGVAQDAKTPLGNAWEGVSISGGIDSSIEQNNLIGGAAPNAGNIIAYNGSDYSGHPGDDGAGIRVGAIGNSIIGNVLYSNLGTGIEVNLFGQKTRISANSIYNNTKLGIDLGDVNGNEGVTPNDLGDTDTGPNNLQNYPIITSITENSDNTSNISGILSSQGANDYILEFFSSSEADSSGYGEGETFLGSTNVRTDLAGNATFTLTVPILRGGSQVITATATDSQGNTAEFSAAFPFNSSLTINNPPTAVNLVNSVTELAKNTDIGNGIKVADITITDDGLGTNNLSLTSTDAGSFTIRGLELFYTDSSPDFETKTQYQVTVNVDDTTVGNTPDASVNFTLAITDVDETPQNQAPSAIELNNTVTELAENSAIGDGIKVRDIAVTDDGLGTNTLSLTGDDSASFEIRGTELFYIGASPDFETKNQYQVTVNVDDPSIGTNPDVKTDFTLNIKDVEPEDPNSIVLDDPLFRFQNSDRPGTYLFAGREERTSIINNYSPPFVEEGFAFNVSYEEQKEGLVRFNRFQNKNVAGTYLFASEGESVNIRKDFSDIFLEEGIAFYAFGAEDSKGVDYYRFHNTQQPGTYIFVGEEEKNSILANFPQFKLEGVAFEVGA